MREIDVAEVSEAVARLCRKANLHLPDDLLCALRCAAASEDGPTGRAVLDELIVNAELAAAESMPICQDTGMTVVFIDIGQDVHLTGGWVEDAIQDGVSRGYLENGLRASVVRDPLQRVNTGDNTPAVIHGRVVRGDRVRIIVAPKGFGSENMSAARMLTPAEGRDGIRDFVLETVSRAGPNPCPPVVIGLGLGGTLEKAALQAKRALLLPTGKRNEATHLAELEAELLQAVNRTGIGPAGLGGRTTALDLHILAYPTHIAGLPVVLNMSCHTTRHAEAEL